MENHQGRHCRGSQGQTPSWQTTSASHLPQKPNEVIISLVRLEGMLHMHIYTSKLLLSFQKLKLSLYVPFLYLPAECKSHKSINCSFPLIKLRASGLFGIDSLSSPDAQFVLTFLLGWVQNMKNTVRLTVRPISLLPLQQSAS